MTEGKFTITFDLTADQAAELWEQCRKEQLPVGEVGPKAIAYYISQRKLQRSNLTKALAD